MGIDNQLENGKMRKNPVFPEQRFHRIGILKVHSVLPLGGPFSYQGMDYYLLTNNAQKQI